MSTELLLIAFVFVGSLVIGVSIAFVLGLVPLIYLVAFRGFPLIGIAAKLYGGIDTYVLLALPFFILAGNIISHTGITRDLVNFSRLIVGRVRGSLAQVNIVVSVIFAGLTGAAVADTAAIGSILIPEMIEEGYTPEYSAAVTVTSSVLGPIIPPSIIMIIYASVTGDSVSTLFMAGFIPGLLVALSLVVLARFYAVKYNHPVRAEKIPAAEALRICRRSLVAILVPVIIIGGILSGLFTPTEAASYACLYACLAGVFYYKTLTLKAIVSSLINAGVVASTVLFLISTSQIFSMLLILEGIPDKVTMIVMAFIKNKYVFLFLINVLFFFMGMVMEASASVILLTPLLLPIAISYGIHPIHFALVMLVNLNIGLCTPPVGACLFTAAPIAKIPMERMISSVMPFVAMEMLAVLLITYIPELVLFIPRVTGFI
jgi:tripartite ATP-independent transporter DctM subunit